MSVEHRAGSEFRAQGRVLSGVVLRYGDISPDFAERFMPGSLAPLPDVPLNLQHDRAMVVLPPGRFVLADSERALEIRAELPASSAALQLCQTRCPERFFGRVLAPSRDTRRRECPSDRARGVGRDRAGRPAELPRQHRRGAAATWRRWPRQGSDRLRQANVMRLSGR